MMSLRRMMLRLTLIPTTAMLVIWLGLTGFGAVVLRHTIVRQQNLLIEAIARQSSQYLTETGYTLQAVAAGVYDLPRQYQRQFLTRIRADYRRFTTLYLVNAEGRVVVEAGDHPELLGLDFSRERFFAPAMQTRAPYFSTPFISLVTNHIAVTGVAPIVVDNQIQALLVAELDLSVLQQAIAPAGIGEQGEAFILDSHGTLVAHPNAAWVNVQRNFGNLPLFQHALASQTTVEIFYDGERGQWAIGSARRIAWGWVVATTQPLFVAARPLILLTALAALAFAASVGVFLWAQISGARQITNPIVRLTRAVDQLAQGELALTGSHSRHDDTFREILSLYQSFTRMAAVILDRTAALQDANAALSRLNEELETRVQQRTADLEAANNDLSSFAYVVSHDLKAPLRAISRLAHWLVTDYAGAFDAEGQHMVDLLIGRVTRMDNLIEGILEYSRIGRLEIEPTLVDLNGVVRNVLDSLAPPEHIQVTLARPLPSVFVNRTRMVQLFQNLIGNAIKFLDKPQGRITIDCAADDEGWRFSVRDNGPGIEGKYHERIFRIFQTLQRRDTLESTGIGLALVKRIVERDGGRVWVESEPGLGSAFWFTLPALADQRAHLTAKET